MSDSYLIFFQDKFRVFLDVFLKVSPFGQSKDPGQELADKHLETTHVQIIFKFSFDNFSKANVCLPLANPDIYLVILD